MPHFDAEGNDTVICQVCAKVISIKTGKEVAYGTDIIRGNICHSCVAIHKQTGLKGEELRKFVADARRLQQPPMSLAQHCAIESGYPIGSRQLDDYINRYYGHG